MAEWTKENAAHLLRRAAFGGQPEDIQDFFDDHVSVEEAVDTLLSFRPSKKKPPKGGKRFRKSKDKQQRWWLKTMLKTRRPGDACREKLVLFLHGHLVSGQSKAEDTVHMALQNRLFRIYARGNFQDLMRDFNRDAANLYYLDGILNYATNDGVHVNVNENFGRELMELFTIGIAQIADDGTNDPDPAKATYSESDVHQLARALTGWVDLEKHIGIWNQDEWDGGQYDDDGDDLADDVVIFGVTNNNFRIDEGVAGTPDDVLELLFTRVDDDGNNQVGMFLSRQLWTWYGYPPPVAGLKAILAGFAAEFESVDSVTGRKYELTPLLRAMWTHDEFYSEAAKTHTVKNPVDYVIQSMKALRVKGNAKEVGDSRQPLGRLLADMGMDLFEPPNVAGWPGGGRWITTGTLLERMSFARYLAEADSGSMRLRLDRIAGLPLDNPAADPVVVVDAILAQLGLDGSGPGTAIVGTQRDTIIEFANGGNPAATLDLSEDDTDDAERRVRGVISLVLQAAENQIF